MEQFGNVNDVDTLTAMLVAQQQQLVQLQAAAAGATAAGTKKRKSSSKSKADEAELLDGSDDDWDPSNDSDYDHAPKKKKQSSKKATTCSSKKQKQSTMDAAHNSSADASAKEQANTAKAAAAALKSIKSVINAQMVYKPSLKYGTSRASLELPCLSESIVAAMLGPELLRKASNGKKQLQLKADYNDLCVMYPNECCPFCKTLRYGATLELISGLTFTFHKETGVLKVHGSFKMMK